MSAPGGADSGRRLLGVALAAFVAGGAALLFAASAVWQVATIERDAPLPPLAYALSGAGAVPMTTALGILALAAVVAVLATGPIGRRVVSVVVAAVATWTLVTMLQWLGHDAARRTEILREDGAAHSVAEAPAAAAYAVPLWWIGLVLTLAAAALIFVAAARMPRMGRKYERPTGQRTPAKTQEDDDAQRARDMWGSLDRGEDPTER